MIVIPNGSIPKFKIWRRKNFLLEKAICKERTGIFNNFFAKQCTVANNTGKFPTDSLNSKLVFS